MTQGPRPALEVSQMESRIAAELKLRLAPVAIIFTIA